MRRFAITLSKNFKLLFRSKETAFTIIFGPLLIILLVGFAFMGAGDDLSIRVATYGAADGFGQNTIDILNSKGYAVSVYPTEDACSRSVKEGAAHACMSFSTAPIGREETVDKTADNAASSTTGGVAKPQDAQDAPETREARPHVTIYLDPSRLNLVDKIAADLSGVLDIQSGALREGMANDAIMRITTAHGLLDADVNTTTRMLGRLTSVSGNLTLAKQSLASVSDAPANISLGGLRGMQLGLAQKVAIAAEAGDAAITEASAMLSDLEDECTECSNETVDAVRDLRDHLELVQDNLTRLVEDDTKRQLDQAQYLLDVAMDDVDALTARLRDESSARRTIVTSIAASEDDAAATLADLRRTDASLRYTRDLLAGQRVDAADIADPVTTTLVSVTGTDSKAAFSYPYLFVMVMMFMGLLLASTLIVTDKTSRASFRNFTTPTPDGYHVFVAFVTAFALLFAEAIVILLVSATFVAQPLLSDAFSTLAIVCVSIITFTFLGMIIGYLSRTQEAAMIASISAGSVLLFVSNLLIPVEGMASVAQLLSHVNPYLVLSELLKKSMLFGVSLQQAASDLSLVIALAIALLALTLFVQRRNRRKYFRQDGGLLAPHIPAPLVLAGRYINNEVELLDCLDHMTRAEFEAVVKTDDNPISSWVRGELRNRSLSRQLRTTSKEKMMLKLDKHLARHGKHMAR